MKPALLIMAAGMGSRYGGLKQIDPIGPNGEVIIDYSLFDAKRAGFEDVYCIIKKEIEEDFKAVMNRGAAKHMNIHYVYQDVHDLPQGYCLPEGRVKPWGTGHAVLSARRVCKQPFAVLNADDYYGPSSFKTLYDYLSKAEDGDTYDFCMVAYQLKNTITENGSVSRGVCGSDEKGNLKTIVERTKIQRNNGIIQYEEGGIWNNLAEDALVSMNMFGFTPVFLKELESRFPGFLDKALAENPLKGEYFLPSVVSSLIDEGKASVKLLSTDETWHGVTYPEDKPEVVKTMKEKIAQGLYPEKLW